MVSHPIIIILETVKMIRVVEVVLVVKVVKVVLVVTHRTTFEKCATGRFLLCCYVKICQLFSKLSGGIFQC